MTRNHFLLSAEIKLRKQQVFKWLPALLGINPCPSGGGSLGGTQSPRITPEITLTDQTEFDRRLFLDWSVSGVKMVFSKWGQWACKNLCFAPVFISTFIFDSIVHVDSNDDTRNKSKLELNKDIVLF